MALYEKLTHSGHLVSTGALGALSGQTDGWALGVRIEADAVIAALGSNLQGLGLGRFTDGAGGTQLGAFYLFRASTGNLRLRFTGSVTTEADALDTIANLLTSGDYLVCFVHVFNDGSNHRDLALYRDRGGTITQLAGAAGSGAGGLSASSTDLRLEIGSSPTVGGVSFQAWTGPIDGFYLLDTATAIVDADRQTFLAAHPGVVAAVDFEADTAGVFEDVSGNGETFTAQGSESTDWQTTAGGDWTYSSGPPPSSLLSARDAAHLRVLSGGAAVQIDTEVNTVRYTQGNGNLDARMDSTSVPGLSDQADRYRIRLDVSLLNASYWVSGNEYKFGVFDVGSRQYSIWLIGTAGAPTTLEIRDNTATPVTTVAYDPLVHQYLGHRWDAAGGNWHWEYSTDGITWADLHSAALQASYDPDDIRIVMLRLENTANATGIGECIVSRINTPAPVARTWPGYMKASTVQCRSVSPVLAEFSAATAFRVKFKVDGAVLRRVIANQERVDLLVPLTDGTESVVISAEWVSGTTIVLELLTPDGSTQASAVDGDLFYAGELVYFDVGQLGTDAWIRVVDWTAATFLVDHHDAAMAAFGGITDPYMVVFPVVGDDVGHLQADGNAAPMRMGALSVIAPSGTPWTGTAVAVTETGAESGLVEHWPMNDGVHATVLKGAEAAYDIALGEGAVYGVDYWSLPSSRPLPFADGVQPADTQFVQNSTPDPTAGELVDGLLVLLRDGSETGIPRLIDTTPQVDLSYGGEFVIEAVTADWPVGLEDSDFDGQPFSIRTQDNQNILGARIGYEPSPGPGRCIEQNGFEDGVTLGANRVGISSAIAGGPWSLRIRVEGTLAYLDYMGRGTGAHTFSTVGSPLNLTDVRNRWGSAIVRRSGKSQQGVAFGPTNRTAWRNEQVGGTVPEASPPGYQVTAVDRSGSTASVLHQIVYVVNALESVHEVDVSLVPAIFPVSAQDVAGSSDTPATLLLYPVQGIDAASGRAAVLAALVLPVTAQDSAPGHEVEAPASFFTVTARDVSGSVDLASTLLVLPRSALDRAGSRGTGPVRLRLSATAQDAAAGSDAAPTGAAGEAVDVVLGWYIEGATAPAPALRYGEQVAGVLEGAAIGSAWAYKRTVDGLPAGRTATAARLEVRERLADDPIIEVEVGPAPTADGQLVQTGSRVAVEIVLDAAATTLIGTRRLFYQLEIEDDAPVVAVLEVGVTHFSAT